MWTWAIIFTHAIRLRRINRRTGAFEDAFWASDDIDAFHAKRGDEKLPSAAILAVLFANRSWFDGRWDKPAR